MLQSIRDHTQGWIAGIIISLLILSFALWGIHSYFISGSVHNTVAVVNGVDITKDELAVTYERLRRQLQAQYANTEIPAAVETGLKERSLQAIIHFQILQQSALKLGFQITQKQIDNFLYSMPEFQVNGQFSFSRFKQILATSLLSASEFIDLIKNTLLVDQPRLGIIFTSFALPNEVTTSMGLIKQERSIQYVVIPFQSVDPKTISISDEAILNFYKQHLSEFKTPEQVSIEYIELSMGDVAAQIHPADPTLKNFYNENSNSFTEPARWKLEVFRLPLKESPTEQEIKQAELKMQDIYKKAQEGKDLTLLANENALLREEQAFQNRLSMNQLPALLQQPVSQLKKAGDMTQPVRTTNGFVIVKAVDYKEIKILPFDAVKNKVSELYTRQKAEEQFADLREKLANLAYEHPESLVPAAQALGLTVHSSGLMTKEKGAKDITANNKVREAAFSDDVINLQNNSDVIQSTTESAIVLRVKSHIAASILPLSAVKLHIIDILRTREIDSKTFKFSQAIVDQLNQATDPGQITQQYRLNWTQLLMIERHSTHMDAAILDAAFSMPRPSGRMKYAVTKVPNGYAVIGLKAVQEGASNNLDQYQVFSAQIQNTQGLLEYELYKQSLMKRAKVEIKNL